MCVGERLGDRVTQWMTINEPLVIAVYGYFTGEYAPGDQNPMATFEVAHHLNLAHGAGLKALRAAAGPSAQVGIVQHLRPVHPATDSEEDRAAAVRYDGLVNRIYLDPILRGAYPEDVLAMIEPIALPIEPGDLEAMSAPIDFLGINYYSRSVVKHDPDEIITEAAEVKPADGVYMGQGEEVYPQGLYELLKRMHEEYRVPRMMVTENGFFATDDDEDASDGTVHDDKRIAYLRDHLAQVHRALDEGVPVDGYFVWTLMDNFEWSHGYDTRMGMVRVDYDTLARSVKDSGRWYAGAIREQGIR